MKKLNADRIVSVSAIIVSLATVFLIIYQTNLMRQEQKSSVMPSLMIGYGSSNDTLNNILNERIWIENRGLGPAFIQKILVKDSLGKHEGDLYNYFEVINSNKNAVGIRRVFPGLIIPKNEGMTLYQKYSDSASKVTLGNYFQYPYEPSNLSKIENHSAVIIIYYTNIYDDEWKIESHSSVPTEVK
jgi:hypothetical protein